MLYPKVYGFITAVSGGWVQEAEYAQRNEECGACPGRITIRASWVARLLEWAGNGPAERRMYCGPCGCPKWYMARLIGWLGKNRWRKHYCPIERHAATEYPDFVTISPSGCGQRVLKIPGGRAMRDSAGEQHARTDS